MQKIRILFLLFWTLLLSGCTANQPAVTQTPTHTIEEKAPVLITTDLPSPTFTVEPTATWAQDISTVSPKSTALPSPTRKAAPTRTATPSFTPDPEEWQSLPVVPTISENVVQIYQHGLGLGNNPRRFSKIGDCGSTPAWFLGDFDRGKRFYELGEYQSLESVIREYQGSFDRTSLAARSGFNASSLFVPLWADRSQCQADEAPLACEYRVHRPTIAFIMLGSNDVWHPEEFEPQMRKIIELSIANGVVPILTTKADNVEGDGSINATIARLALEYDIPLWNFWLAVQELPNQGLQEDQVHLTWGRNFFDDQDAMQKAWPVRNLTALQVLEAIWRAVTG